MWLRPRLLHARHTPRTKSDAFLRDGRYQVISVLFYCGRRFKVFSLHFLFHLANCVDYVNYSGRMIKYQLSVTPLRNFYDHQSAK